jgi:exosortase
VRLLRYEPFLVPVLGVSLASAQVTLLYRADRIPEMVVSCLVWMGAAVLLGDGAESPAHGQRLRRVSRRDGLAIALLTWCLLVLTFAARFYDPWLLILPLVALAALAALHGVRLRSRTARDLLLVALLVPLQKLITPLFPVEGIVNVTARLACGALRTLGHVCRVEGTTMQMARGSIEVAPPCAGVDSLALAITAGLLFLVLFPVRRSWLHGVALLATGLAITFLVNALRVVLLTFASRSCDAKWWTQWCGFEFWHTGAGSHLFVLVAVSAVCGLWWWDSERAGVPEVPA